MPNCLGRQLSKTTRSIKLGEDERYIFNHLTKDGGKERICAMDGKVTSWPNQMLGGPREMEWEKELLWTDEDELFFFQLSNALRQLWSANGSQSCRPSGGRAWVHRRSELSSDLTPVRRLSAARIHDVPSICWVSKSVCSDLQFTRNH